MGYKGHGNMGYKGTWIMRYKVAWDKWGYKGT